jgi:phospholipase D-like protein
MRNILVLIVIGVAVYCLFDILRSSRDERLGVHPILWMLLVVLIPLVGSLVWLGIRWSRRTAYATLSDAPPTTRPARLRSSAPDDDPDFLRRLDEDRRRNDDPPPAAS